MINKIVRRLHFNSSDIFSSSSREKFLCRFGRPPTDILETERRNHFAVLSNKGPVEVHSRSSLSVPMVRVSGSPALLFTRRSKRLRQHGGAVSFPGGGVEEGDRNIVDTALRETFEEVGVLKENVEVWSVMDPVRGRVVTGPSVITPVVGQIHQDISQLVINESEVEEVFTVDISRLADPAYHGYTQFRLGETNLIFLICCLNSKGCEISVICLKELVSAVQVQPRVGWPGVQSAGVQWRETQGVGGHGPHLLSLPQHITGPSVQSYSQHADTLASSLYHSIRYKLILTSDVVVTCP